MEERNPEGQQGLSDGKWTDVEIGGKVREEKKKKKAIETGIEEQERGK